MQFDLRKALESKHSNGTIIPTLKMWRTVSNILFKPGSDGYNLPLAGPAIHVILVDLAYIGFVFKIGPKLMQNRKAFDLKNALIIYNVIQILWNGYLGLASTIAFIENNCDIGCIRQFPEDHPMKYLEVRLVYMYYLNKYVDYADTVFFVLRKSYRQITFLHVYHHIIMTMISYIHLRIQGYGGHASMIGIFNTFVHTAMYTYYLLSAMNPTFRKNYKGWKRRITEIQIIQFIIIFFHQMWPVVVRVDCDYPKIWCVFGSSQALFMLYLFGKFYRKTYLLRGSATSKSDTDSDSKDKATEMTTTQQRNHVEMIETRKGK